MTKVYSSKSKSEQPLVQSSRKNNTNGLNFPYCLLFGQKMSIIVYFEADSSIADSLHYNTYHKLIACLFHLFAKFSLGSFP